jgi:hypothetical protein
MIDPHICGVVLLTCTPVPSSCPTFPHSGSDADPVGGQSTESTPVRLGENVRGGTDGGIEKSNDSKDGGGKWRAENKSEHVNRLFLLITFD